MLFRLLNRLGLPNMTATYAPTARYATWLIRLKLVRRIPAKLAKLVISKGSRWYYHQLGFQFLDKPKTAYQLEPYQRLTYPANSFSLAEVADLSNPAKVYFPAIQSETEPVSVWLLGQFNATLRQLPYGVIRSRKYIFCLDINTDDFFRNVLHRQKRQPVSTKTLIAPWSHYLDGVVWGGYFDFVMLVAGKLCRIKEAIPETTFNEAIVAYPLFDTAYEREYLSLLDIDSARIVDSRTTQVRFEYCVLANTGHWFYPNKGDIDALRKHILPKLSPPTGKRNRVYISRAGRRRVVNESELLDLLRRYDIELIDDKPRSVAEQVAIYQNAEFIIGPHGASFVNILWCQPGTHLFELFAPTYFPDFYRNMAEQLGLRYSAYFHGPAGTGGWAEGLEADMYVSVDELERCLAKVLPTNRLD